MSLTDAQKVVRNDTAKRMAMALEGIETALGGLGSDNAKKADLTAISATGTTNATGATITAGTYFYLNGALVQAKLDIASGAAFTNGTNYEAVTAGGLNSLNAGLASLNSQVERKNITITSATSDVTLSTIYSNYAINGVGCICVSINVSQSIGNFEKIINLDVSGTKVSLFTAFTTTFENTNHVLYVDDDKSIKTGGNGLSAGNYVISCTFAT